MLLLRNKPECCAANERQKMLLDVWAAAFASRQHSSTFSKILLHVSNANRATSIVIAIHYHQRSRCIRAQHPQSTASRSLAE